MTGWPALFGALGAVAIVFALLITLVSAFQPVPDLTWVWGNLVIGVVLLGSAVFSSLDSIQERLSSGEGRRAGKYGSSALLSTLLGIALLAMLAFLGTRYSTRIDWTEQSVHTLTDQSVKVLKGLEGDVVVTALYPELAAQAVRNLLGRYQAESDRFRLEFADPNSRPDLVQLLGVDEADLGQGLLHVAVGDESVQVTELNEEKLTNALVQLTRSSEKKVYFLAGHAERAIEGEDGEGKEGFREAAQSLRNENYKVESLVVAQVGKVPEDADVLILAGPTRPLPERELAALTSYVDAGGALLVLLDPRANSNLAETLAGWGLRAGEDIVVDLQLAFFQQYFSPFAGAYSAEHPITKDLGEERDPTLFHNARSVEVTAEGEASGYEVIVYTGDQSWAERDLAELGSSGRVSFGAGDLKGPVPVAVAAEIPRGQGGSADADDAEAAGASEEAISRIVVVGDSDFATNEFMARYGGNRDLFVNSVNWLLGDVEAISVRPHQSRASRFTGSEEDVRAIQYLSLFVLPEAIAVLGVLAWWWRRKSPGR